MKRIVTIQDISCVGKCSLTEASYLLGIPYRTDRNEEELHELLRDFAGLGAKNVVLTGVSLRPGELGAMGYSAASGTFFYHASEHLPVRSPAKGHSTTPSGSPWMIRSNACARPCATGTMSPTA